MRTPLAWLNLVHQRKRTLVALAGIAFAIILVFMQLGFFGSVMATATQYYDKMNFDILLISPQYVDMNKCGTFPLSRIYQAQQVAGVAHAYPLWVGFNRWRNAEDGSRRNILVLGFRLADPIFRMDEVNDKRAALQKRDTVLMDLRSRKDFGSRDTGVKTELGNLGVEIVGQFSLGAGFGADGTLITSAENFVTLVPARSLDRAGIGLVLLEEGQDPESVAEQLRLELPPDVRVVTRAVIESAEEYHWVHHTSVGVIFGLGVIVAVIVGMVFVYQVISSDIAQHMGEYATLKAMGYHQKFLSRVVLEQALLLAGLAYFPALAVSLVLYKLTAIFAHLPIEMNVLRALLVLVLSIGMCAASGLLSVRKVHKADPADLF